MSVGDAVPVGQAGDGKARSENGLGMGGDDGKVVPAPGQVGAIDPEDLADDGQLEDRRAGSGNPYDPVGV